MLLHIFGFEVSRRVRVGLAISTAIAMLAALLWCLPLVISSRAVWPQVAARFTANWGATYTDQAVSLHWLSPVSLHGVRIEAPDGELLAAVDTLRTEQTLLSLLIHGNDFGALHLQHPQIYLQLHSGGSNLEQLLSAYLEQESTSAGPVRGKIHVVDGLLKVSVPTRQDIPQTRYTDINGVIALNTERVGQGSVELNSCRVLSDSQPADTPDGSWKATLAWHPAGSSRDWSFITDIQSLDLTLLQSLLERFNITAELAGKGTLRRSVVEGFV